MVDKQKMIDQHVFQQFSLARSNFGRVHDIDLRRWAMEKGSEVYLISIEEKTFGLKRALENIQFISFPCSSYPSFSPYPFFIHPSFISSIGWSY